MRVRQLLIAATAAIALYASSASAIMYVDDQPYYAIDGLGIHMVAPDLGTPAGSHGTFTDHFDIALGTPDAFPVDVFGYTPGTMITDGYISFVFGAGGTAQATVQVDLGSDIVPELFYRNTAIDIGVGDNLAANLILQLQSNGQLEFQVTALRGDFYLLDATLYANDAQAYPTPDGGVTVALLGLGCLGLVGVGRRFAV